MKKNTLLVTYDFTPEADNAISHAVTLAKRSNAIVQVLHIVNDNSDVEDARKKLTKKLETISSNEDYALEPYIRIGSIFEEIGDHATEIGARFVFMATHGMNLFQKLTGSRALKVITNSDSPFIVVQERKPRAEGYKKIVLPLDLSRDSKQKLKHAATVASHFDSKIFIIIPKEDTTEEKNDILRNVKFAKQYLTEKGAECEVHIAAGNDDFEKEVIRFAGSVEADLITIMNTGSESLLGVLGSSYAQTLITNDAHIPVLTVNPKEVGTGGGQGLFG
jgi:nucleotide-binding universal stress UspA family protein